MPISAAWRRRAALMLASGDKVKSLGLKPLARLVSYAHAGVDPAKVNPNVSGISLGHPVGATGAVIATKAIHELHRIGGGQGIATVFERA
jgi:acetyl-CoA C-acetyltransferase